MKKKKSKTYIEEFRETVASAFVLAKCRGIPRLILVQELVQMAGTALAIANSPVACILDHPGYWCGVIPEGVKPVKKKKVKP